MFTFTFSLLPFPNFHTALYIKPPINTLAFMIADDDGVLLIFVHNVFIQQIHI